MLAVAATVMIGVEADVENWTVSDGEDRGDGPESGNEGRGGQAGRGPATASWYSTAAEDGEGEGEGEGLAVSVSAPVSV